jgi:hypothetical protein
MPGPYFPGQLPSECGHYYPDVIRLRDEKRTNGQYVRIIDCVYCGRSEEILDPRSLAPGILRRLKREGIDHGGDRREDLAAFRRREIAKLTSISTSTQTDQREPTSVQTNWRQWIKHMIHRKKD